MSVPTFIDLTGEEQCQELRSFFHELNNDFQEECSPEGLAVDLPDIIGECDKCLQPNNETGDAERVLNGIVSVFFVVPYDNGELLTTLVPYFCEKLTKAPTTKMAMVCQRVLQNLYEGLPEQSPLRYDVYYNIIKIAKQTDTIHQVFTDIDKLKTWTRAKNISTEKLQKLLRLLHSALAESNHSELASKVMIELLGTYTEDNASQAREDAHKCIVACLCDPSTFLMDHLLTLKPVRFLEGELIHDLLTIFVSEKLSSYLQFYEANTDFILSLGLSHQQSLHKMRLLTFMQMAETRREIPFEIIKTELQLKSEEVESFIIDVLRTKMVQAKMDQVHKQVIVSSTMHRTFGKPQWQLLREILTRWHNNLGQIENSLQTIVQTQFDQIPPIHG